MFSVPEGNVILEIDMPLTLLFIGQWNTKFCAILLLVYNFKMIWWSKSLGSVCLAQCHVFFIRN